MEYSYKLRFLAQDSTQGLIRSDAPLTAEWAFPVYCAVLDLRQEYSISRDRVSSDYSGQRFTL